MRIVHLKKVEKKKDEVFGPDYVSELKREIVFSNNQKLRNKKSPNGHSGTEFTKQIINPKAKQR